MAILLNKTSAHTRPILPGACTLNFTLEIQYFKKYPNGFSVENVSIMSQLYLLIYNLKYYA